MQGLEIEGDGSGPEPDPQFWTLSVSNLQHSSLTD